MDGCLSEWVVDWDEGTGRLSDGWMDVYECMNVKVVDGWDEVVRGGRIDRPDHEGQCYLSQGTHKINILSQPNGKPYCRV